MWFDYMLLGVATVGVGVVATNWLSIASYVFDLVTIGPGVGRLYSRTNPRTKKRNVFVDTDFGTIKLPFVKLPSPDTEIYFFHEADTVKANSMVDLEHFNEHYKTKTGTTPKRYEMGIITEIMRPKDFKGKNKISGFVYSMFEEHVYLFTVEDNQIINYEEIFDDFDEALAKIE